MIKANKQSDIGNKFNRLYDSNGKYIRLSVDEIIARRLNTYRGWQCSAGALGLYVDYDGNVWRANCAGSANWRFDHSFFRSYLDRKRSEQPEKSKIITDDTNTNGLKGFIGKEFLKQHPYFYARQPLSKKSARQGYLGNIYDGFKKTDKWSTCPYDKCGCGADVILPKAKGKKAKQFALSPQYQSEINNPDYVDKIENFTAQGTEEKFKKQILWDIGRLCNYDCSYCWPSAHSSKERPKPFDTIKTFTEEVVSEWGKGQPMRWLFGGGEPTLHPNFIEWMKYLKDLNQWTLVTTNGSRSPEYFKKLTPQMNNILISVHFEHCDLNNIYENTKVILNEFSKSKEDHWLELKLMTPPGTTERSLEVKRKLEQLCNDKKTFSVSLAPIRDLSTSFNLKEYSKKELNTLQNQTTQPL